MKNTELLFLIELRTIRHKNHGALATLVGRKKNRKKVNVFLLAVRGFLNMINCETKIGTLWVIEKSNIIKPKMQNVQIRRTYRGHDRLLFCQSVYNYIGSHLNKDRERALLHSHSNVHTADPLQRQGS